MEANKIISCYQCGQKLRVPFDRGELTVTCPNCRQKFSWSKEKGIFCDAPKPTSAPYKRVLKIAGVLLIVIAALYFLGVFETPDKDSTNPFVDSTKTVGDPESAFAPRRLNKSSKASRWITVGYSELLDKQDVIHSGRTLGSALKDPSLKGQLQPFLDKYTYLLPHVLDTQLEPPPNPQQNIIDRFPVGSRQPAWIALFRGGRIHLTTDYQNNVRLFLEGTNPEIAYKKNYPIVRHCLSGLLPDDDSALNIEVYAYQKNYASCELRLNVTPYTLQASKFPTPSKKTPIDLQGLQEFFEKGGQLEGAELTRKNKLILYAKKGPKLTVASAQLNLSDLAVVYRACFHAGDNQAFISLDPHKDPTKVKVNFGGYLEDTRVGHVVLEADKRFKTLTTGLDPTSFSDIRSKTREKVPGFMTCFEREMLSDFKSNPMSKTGWTSTRYWFYPESVEVETDLSNRYALVTNPVFTADAERSQDDFTSKDQFNMLKKATLSPAIRHNIDAMNQNYSQYAEAFSEIKELMSVGRLMGLCSWLLKANPQGIDLDALLAVEIPEFRTPREKDQLIAATALWLDKTDNGNIHYVRENSPVYYLTPRLNTTISEYLSDPKQDNQSNESKFIASRAQNLLLTAPQEKVRTLIATENDLKAFVSDSTGHLEVPMPEKFKAISDEISDKEKLLKSLENEIDSLEKLMNYSSTTDHNRLVGKYNKLVGEYESHRVSYNRIVGQYNSYDLIQHSYMRITGGINLEPEFFNIKKTDSPRLKRFIQGTKSAAVDFSGNSSASWIRSSVGRSDNSVGINMKNLRWLTESEDKQDGGFSRHVTSDSDHDYWYVSEKGKDQWRDLIVSNGMPMSERYFTKGDQSFQIVEYYEDTVKNHITGKFRNSDRIDFKYSDRTNLMKPRPTPVWWPASDEKVLSN